jgi:hypothetical protein
VIQEIEDVIQALQKDEVVCRYEFGDSMQPILQSGEYCKLTPLKSNQEASIGDAVFCCVHGCWMTHMVWNVSHSSANGTFYLIGSSSGDMYGWTNKVLAIAQGTNVVEEYNFDLDEN